MSEELKDHSRDTLEKCERLLANADFAWFLEEAVGRPLAEADEVLKGLTTTKDARENAAHVRKALDEVWEFIGRRRDVAARFAAPAQ